MNNPIKNYFQKIYQETGKKPFTFIQPFCLLILPLIMVIFGLIMENNLGTQKTLTIMAVVVVIGWIAFIAIPFIRLKGKGIGVFFLSILASIIFFISFILWPMLKFAYRGGQAITQANMGNTSASVNASQRMGATKGKKSALNWFEYDGYVWKDEKEVLPEMTDYALDEGSYSLEQNTQARAKGFSNGKDAEMQGRTWNGTDWV